MADGYVQVAPDGGGKLIDGQSLTNGASQTVYRQTVTVGDPSSIGNVAGVTNGGLNNFGVGVAYTAGSGNSSTSQLAAGASFTGTVDSVTTQSAAEIGVICDLSFGQLYSWAYSVAGVTGVSAVTLNGLSGDTASIAGNPQFTIKTNSCIVS